MLLISFCDFISLTLLYRYRASDFQFPFGPSTTDLRLLPQAQAERSSLNM